MERRCRISAFGQFRAVQTIGDFEDQIQHLADLEEADWQDRQAPEEAGEPAWTAEQVRQAADRVDQALTAREQRLMKMVGRRMPGMTG